MGEIIWQAVGAIATAVAAVTAIWALWQARELFKAQQQLSRELTEKQLTLSEQLNHQQMLLSRRQMFFSLFEQFKGMKNINPTSPVWPDVVAAVNFMDLLGICWEGQLVDEKLIFRVFREYVLETYGLVSQCTSADEVQKSGEVMLRESRSATALYHHLLNEHIYRDLPPPLQ